MGSERSEELLRYITQPWFHDNPGVVRPEFTWQAGLTERACRSPTRLTDACANSRAFFNESTLRLEDCNGSNGGPFRALSMVGKSQGGTRASRYFACDSHVHLISKDVSVISRKSPSRCA